MTQLLWSINQCFKKIFHLKNLLLSLNVDSVKTKKTDKLPVVPLLLGIACSFYIWTAVKCLDVIKNVIIGDIWRFYNVGLGSYFLNTKNKIFCFYNLQMLLSSLMLNSLNWKSKHETFLNMQWLLVALTKTSIK